MPEVIRNQRLQVRAPTKQRSSPSTSRAPWLMKVLHVVVGYKIWLIGTRVSLIHTATDWNSSESDTL